MSVMSSSWCTTLRPGKSGLPSRISAKMQPMDQMSMAGEYFAKNEPQSSGARYHLQHRESHERHFVSRMLDPQAFRAEAKHRTAWQHSRSRRWWSACR